MADTKQTKSVSLETYLIRKANNIIEQDKDFSTLSGLVSIALSEFFIKYENEKGELSCTDLLTRMLLTHEGRRAYERVTGDSLDDFNETKRNNHSGTNEEIIGAIETFLESEEGRKFIFSYMNKTGHTDTKGRVIKHIKIE